MSVEIKTAGVIGGGAWGTALAQVCARAGGDVVLRERRSLVFKKMQIVRGCDAKRNVLVYYNANIG